ncbi:UPF0149 family protein [Yanghanlia caeni]|uniref:UPF0149 family protein n=1 Tax=Yanghanlia caeni TaxID=3064283 RepID=A0ABU1D845_9BURK|nr:UPF0149 family protein [Alcaligenaceae bacterium LG-2]
MHHAAAPLSDDELQQLSDFLLDEVESEGMTLEILDGYLHAIAIGPVTIHPLQWLPKVWGTEGPVPQLDSIEDINYFMGLVMRLFNGIIHGLECDPREFSPVWACAIYRGRDYIDAESWAYGFVEGMKLCWADWAPMLNSQEGQAWFRPIALLGEDDYCPEQDELTKTPARRGKIAEQIPAAFMAMHEYWLPYRLAVHERQVAGAMRAKVGRNDPCPCGSGKKFKKCCGAPLDLH